MSGAFSGVELTNGARATPVRQRTDLYVNGIQSLREANG